MKNKRINVFLITLFWVTAYPFSLFAQINNDIDSTASQLSATVAQDGGFLWKVSGNGLPKSSYIFGTYDDNYHRFTESQVFSIPGLRKALEEAEEIATENNIYTLFNTSLIRERILSTSAITRMPKGEHYYYLFKSDKEWQKFDEQMKKEGFQSYSDQKPTYWINILKIGFTVQTSLPPIMNQSCIPWDFYITKYAKEKKMPMFFLNPQSPGSPGFYAFFDTIYTKANEKLRYKRPLKVQIKELCKLLNQIESPKYKEQCEEDIKRAREKYDYVGIRDSLFAAYKTMNIKKLEDITEVVGKDFPFYKAFILERPNIRWIPIMKEQMAKHTCFVAFGCRHLVGEKGIINLLRKEGYEVTPVF